MKQIRNISLALVAACALILVIMLVLSQSARAGSLVINTKDTHDHISDKIYTSTDYFVTISPLSNGTLGFPA